MEDVNIYERIDIVVHGQQLTARPIGFELDADENPIAAIRYETTCPICGNSIQFQAQDVSVNNGVVNIECKHCVGQSCSGPTLVVNNPGQIVEKQKQAPIPAIVDRGCPFVDPVELGVFDPVGLYDKPNPG